MDKRQILSDLENFITRHDFHSNGTESKAISIFLSEMLKELSKGTGGIPYKDFERILLKAMDNVTVGELHQVIKFACEQLGFWEAEWLFSLAYSPNTVAEAETDGWRQICNICSDVLVKNTPDSNVRDQLTRYQELAELQPSMRRRLDYNKTRPFQKITTMIFSRTSRILNKLGFRMVALLLQRRALFPKGTVGRKNG